MGVLGPRQVGKSTFLMNQWCDELDAKYITFDDFSTVNRAKNAPEQLLLGESDDQKRHLIIDEAQKIPHIFDSIKAIIDRNRCVGAFTLSGSTEFSSKSGVRESLAGRMGITRLYPMTLREISGLDFASPWVSSQLTDGNGIKAKTVETWLECGGMPVFCSLSDMDERHAIINSWLEAICYRDIKQLKDADYDSDLAYNILKTFASKPLIPLAKLASDLSTTTVTLKKHIEALEELFLIYKIPSFDNPNALSMYRVFDAGVLNCLLSGNQTIFSRTDCLNSLLINEIYAQYEYSGKQKPQLHYYRTRGGAEIDLVLKTNDRLIGIECVVNANIDTYKQRGMRSFLKNHPEATGYFIAPVSDIYKIDKNIVVIPWNFIG